MKSNKVYFAATAAFAAALLAGCAAGPSAGAGKGENASVLRERATERWNLLIAHKADKAWDYLSPGYRQTKPRDAYAQEMNSRGVRWSKVTYGSQECEPDACKVHLFVDYKLDMGGLAGTVESSAPLTETWVKVDGRWYYLPDQIGPTKL